MFAFGVIFGCVLVLAIEALMLGTIVWTEDNKKPRRHHSYTSYKDLVKTKPEPDPDNALHYDAKTSTWSKNEFRAWINTGLTEIDVPIEEHVYYLGCEYDGTIWDVSVGEMLGTFKEKYICDLQIFIHEVMNDYDHKNPTSEIVRIIVHDRNTNTMFDFVIEGAVPEVNE